VTVARKPVTVARKPVTVKKLMIRKILVVLDVLTFLMNLKLTLANPEFNLFFYFFLWFRNLGGFVN
jgi:hypothetical protein